MKPNEIKVGETYRNRGAGWTRRTVLEIGRDIPCEWLGGDTKPTGPVVRYRQDGVVRTLYLESFANWAGGVV